MKITDKIIKKIIAEEGFVPEIYQDVAGVDTIGIGFAIKDLYISEEVCELILKEKLQLLEDRFIVTYDWYDDAPQKVKNTCINMAYQLGFRGFSAFRKTIAYLADKDYKSASVEMLDSKWAKQTPDRAKELSEIIKSL